MELTGFLVVVVCFFAALCAGILLVRTHRHSKQLRANEQELKRLKEAVLRQDARVAALGRTLREAGILARDEAEGDFFPAPGALFAPDHDEPGTADAFGEEVPHDSGPESQEPPTVIPGAADAENPPSSAAGGAPSLIAILTRFIKGGNLWVAGGVVLLFVAFGLLLSYITRRGFFTIEMRIAAAIACGLGMFIFGWKFRGRKPVYALVIQGGGIGVLYLSFFAASKLTELLPAPAALALVSLLMPSTIIPAILQNSQALAIFGLLGGFSAPILLSSASGNYLALFAYYTILDLAVVVIARHRLWRVLNMMAALCTFAVALAWVAGRYQPEMFVTVEPFMLGFILIFTFLGIQSAKSVKKPLKNYVDLPLTIGTPFLGALTQWRIFSYIDHGPAIICIAFSAFYLFVTRIIRKKSGAGIRGLAEGYLGFSLLLANLALPLELSARLTGAVWAAEAVLIFAFGCRLNSRRLRVTSLVCHLVCVAAFFVELSAYSGPSRAEMPAFRNPVFIGGLIIAVSALVCAVFAVRAAAKNRRSRLFTLSTVLGGWGLLWWLASWGAEFFRLPEYSLADFFICASLTALLAYAAGRRFGCPALLPGIAAPFLIALYTLCSHLVIRAAFYFDTDPLDMLTINFFEGPFLGGWLLFFTSQAFLLWHARTARSSSADSAALIAPPLHAFWLALCLFISVTVLTCTGRAYTQMLNLARSWRSFAGVLPSFVCVTALSLPARRWGGAPAAYRTMVLIRLPRILCAAVSVWFAGTLFSAGDPAPLPLYIPLVNPPEIQQAFCIALILLHQLSLRRAGIQPVWKNRTLFIIVDGMIFLWLTAMMLRASRWFMDLSFSRALSSGEFQLALLVLWGVYGISHILAGYRMGLRGLWLAGAVVMVIDIAKLLLVDLAKTGTVTRIISFFVAGLLLLFIGWAAPLPPAHKETSGVKNE
ncbi:MAG: DUF2339 domain-containing protein [Treponema sp.]|jgi:uncharacterized membrane protein|nr:DUF2339 domain-containing protein [Treponema sp.]